nr:MAG TPA: hypothetical protein [Bacteriophage sp.]
MYRGYFLCTRGKNSLIYYLISSRAVKLWLEIYSNIIIMSSIFTISRSLKYPHHLRSQIRSSSLKIRIISDITFEITKIISNSIILLFLSHSIIIISIPREIAITCLPGSIKCLFKCQHFYLDILYKNN